MQCELYVSGLFTLSSLPVLKGTQKEQRWQHVNYNDLTCHVAVYLCGPQGTTPIRINGVEARGAANQLVGLTRWLVDGWKKQSGDRIQLFLRESARPPTASSCLTHLTAQHLYLWTFYKLLFSWWHMMQMMVQQTLLFWYYSFIVLGRSVIIDCSFKMLNSCTI